MRDRDIWTTSQEMDEGFMVAFVCSAQDDANDPWTASSGRLQPLPSTKARTVDEKARNWKFQNRAIMNQ